MLLREPISGEVAPDAVTEEKRLAALVAAVDESCAVAPRGALLLDARHRVVPSPSFKGLAPEQAMDLKCYVHWRMPTQADKKKAFDTKGLTQTSDFLDTIHADQPTVSPLTLILLYEMVQIQDLSSSSLTAWAACSRLLVYLSLCPFHF